MPKKMIFDYEARDSLRRGLNQLSDTVRITLGPCGRNVILAKQSGTPVITNDGITIAREIELRDPFENMGARLGQEVGTKMQSSVGDGTTTAVVLAQAVVQEGFRLIGAGADPMAVKRGMDKAVRAMVVTLNDLAQHLREDSELERVATLAAGDDPEIGGMVAEGLRSVGRNGVFTVEEGHEVRSHLEVVSGARIERGYLSPYFVTDTDTMTAVLEDAWVLVYDRKITATPSVQTLLELAAKAGRALLVIAEDVEGDALASLVVNRLRGSLKVAAIKAPSFGTHRRDLLDDLAVLTGGRLVTAEAGLTLESVSVDDLGQARRVVLNRDDTTLVGGGGQESAVQDRLRFLEDRLDAEEDDQTRTRLKERMALLSGAVASLKVGAATEVELRERRSRVEDALAAARAALEEGVVPGGGVAYLRLAEAQPALEGDEALGVEALCRALAAPTRQIAENAGAEGGVVVREVQRAEGARGYNAVTGKYEDLIKRGILDPAKVVRAALENAVSIAGLILTVETLVADVADET